MAGVRELLHSLDAIPAGLEALFEEAQKPLPEAGFSSEESSTLMETLRMWALAARMMKSVFPIVVRLQGGLTGDLDAALAHLAGTWLRVRGAKRMLAMARLPGGAECLGAVDDAVKAVLEVRRRQSLELSLGPYPPSAQEAEKLIAAEIAEIERSLADLRVTESNAEDRDTVAVLERERQRILLTVSPA